MSSPAIVGHTRERERRRRPTTTKKKIGDSTPSSQSPIAKEPPPTRISVREREREGKREGCEMGFRCIECGFRIGNNKPLFVQYSPGNIRLMKCENCKAVADEYIECEIMILLIDLILHKPKAYRHLLYNLLNPQSVNLQGLFWKTAFAFLLLDAYRVLLLNRSEEGWVLSASLSILVSRCGKVVMDLLFGNFVFLSFLLLVTRYFLEASFRASRYTDVLLAIFISSYFKIFLIVMMIWEFPSSVLFIIDIFVLSSNTVALKVITESSIEKCIGACFSAHAVKLFFRRLLDMACRDH